MLANDPSRITAASVVRAPVTLSLSRRAERFPDRTAVVDISEERLYAPAETISEERLTYGDLSTLADWAGARLSGLDIDPGDTVCLVSRNRVLSLALLFACRRLGATLAPISHLLTPVTVERPFDAIDPELVVAEPAQRDLVRSIPFDRSVTLEELATVSPEADWRDESDASNPLLCLHGDGGQPVAGFSARTLEWNCITALVTWGITQDDVAPLVAPLSTPDGLIRVALPLLYAGGRLLLDRAFDPGDALTAIAAENATLLAGRTPALRDLAAEPAFDDAIGSIERVIADSTVEDDVLEPYREVSGTAPGTDSDAENGNGNGNKSERRNTNTSRIAVSRAYGRLECPTVLAQSVERNRETPDGERADAQSVPGAVGRPVLDCRVRLVDAGDAELEGAGTGRLQVTGPIVADERAPPVGSESKADTRAETEREHEAVESDATDADSSAAGRFVDGWFDTGQPFARDEDGRYVRR